MLKLRIDSDLQGIGCARWEALRARSPAATVFQSYRWLHAWGCAFGAGTPLILSAWEEDHLVGAAAVFVDEHNTLRLIGEEHADYGEFLIEADRRDVYEALLNALWQPNLRWQRLQWEAVPVHSPLAQALRRRGAWAQDPVPCPRVIFADRSLQSLLAKESLKRHAKLLERQGPVTVEHLESSAQIAPYLSEFFEQHQARWAGSKTPSLFENRSNRLFYEQLVKQAIPGGEVLFSVIKVEDHPVAMHLGLRSQGELIWYKPTFDPTFSRCGPGEVLLAQLLEQASREGARGIDFTRGDEAFKLRFASDVRHVVTFHARAVPWRHQGARTLWWAREQAIRGLRAVGMYQSAARLWRLLKRLRAGFGNVMSVSGR